MHFDAHELMQLDAQTMNLQWFATDVAEVQQAVDDGRIEIQSFVTEIGELIQSARVLCSQQ